MVGIAVLGAGLFAKEAHLPALIKHQADILAVYSRSIKSAQSLVTAAAALDAPTSHIDVYADELTSENKGLSALLKREDIGAVIVALPILIQPEVVRQCLAAGKHVLCEKPVAKNVQTAVQLISDYEKDFRPRGLVFSVAEQFRYDRAFTRARELVVAGGRIGKLNHIHARVWGNIQPVENQYYETEWRKNPEYQGGFVLDGGVHFIALIRYVSGLEIVKTLSMCRQTYPHLPPLDTVNAALQFDSGASGSLSICFASCKGVFEFVFVGDQGSVTISAVEDAKDRRRIVIEKADGTKDEEIIDGEGVSEEVKAFLEAASSGKHEEKAGAREALADVAVVESLCAGGGPVQALL